MKKVRIGTDIGITYTKAVMFDDEGVKVKTCFLSTPELTETKGTTESSNEVIYHGERYIIGEPNQQVQIELGRERSKNSKMHKICFLAAICDVIEQSGTKDVTDVVATVNMTRSEYMNKEEREAFVKYYSSPAFIEVTYNNVKYVFKLKVVAYYEGLGAMLIFKDKYRVDSVLTMDFGSRNLGLVTFENLKPRADRSRTLEFGCNKLLSRVEVLLEDRGFAGITTEKEILEVLNGMNDKIDADTIQMAKNEVLDYLREMHKRLSDLGYNVDYGSIIASGGAFKLYEPHFKQVFKSKIEAVNMPEFANAEGTLKLLK